MTTAFKIPAAPYRKKLQRLIGQGMCVSELARRSGQSRSTIDSILKGQSSIYTTTAKNLRDLDPTPPQPAQMPALVSQRKLQALVAIGFIYSELSAGIKISRTSICTITTGYKTHVSATMATRINTFYQEHKSDAPRPLSRHSTQRQWPAPNQWIDIDHPHCRPLSYAGPRQERS